MHFKQGMKGQVAGRWYHTDSEGIKLPQMFH